MESSRKPRKGKGKSSAQLRRGPPSPFTRRGDPAGSGPAKLAPATRKRRDESHGRKQASPPARFKESSDPTDPSRRGTRGGAGGGAAERRRGMRREQPLLYGREGEDQRWPCGKARRKKVSTFRNCLL